MRYQITYYINSAPETGCARRRRRRRQSGRGLDSKDHFPCLGRGILGGSPQLVQDVGVLVKDVLQERHARDLEPPDDLAAFVCVREIDKKSPPRQRRQTDKHRAEGTEEGRVVVKEG